MQFIIQSVGLYPYMKQIKPLFIRMRKNGMTKDFSWDHTASEYESLYEDAPQVILITAYQKN